MRITCHMCNTAWFDKTIVWPNAVLFWCGCFNFKANSLLGWIGELQICCDNFCEWTYATEQNND